MHFATHWHVMLEGHFELADQNSDNTASSPNLKQAACRNATDAWCSCASKMST